MFTPTQEMIDAAAEVLARQVVYEAVEVIVTEYERELLKDFEVYESGELSEDPARITEPSQIFMCDNLGKLEEFERLSNRKRDELGLKVAKPEFNPALAADCNLRHAQAQLFKAMAPVIGTDLGSLCGKKRADALELCMRLLSPLVDDQKSKRRLYELANEAGLNSPALRHKVAEIQLP